MLLWSFLVGVTLIWLIFATVTDIKKREVPDWLSYSLVVIGLGSRLIYSIIMKDISYILWGLLGFLVFFAFANLMYFTKQWGGGDSKLLMGLGAILGNYQSIFYGLHKFPFLITLLINIFIAGTVYGVIYSMFLGFKNLDEFLIEFKKRDLKELKILFCLVIILGVISFLVLGREFSYLVILLLIFLLLGIILLYAIKIIEDVSLYRILEVNKLTEGDWLVSDIIKHGKVVCKAKNIGLTKDDITKLKKNHIKKVLIKEGIPFVPGFLIGFLISIIWGDILFILI